MYKVNTNFKIDFSKKLIKKFLKINQEKYCFENENRSLAVFAHTNIGKEIFIEGLYERKELYILLEFIKSMGINLSECLAIDIGANIGNHTLYFSRFFKEVYAFEPHPDAFSLLSFNTRNLDNIKIFNFGIGDKNEDVYLFHDPHHIGHASAIYKKGRSIRKKINLKKFDQLVIPKNIHSLLKIDVEGMEFEVLKGSLNYIKNLAPIICFEQHKSDFDTNNSTKSIRFLSKHGYVIFYIEKEINIPNFFIKLIPLEFRGFIKDIFSYNFFGLFKNHSYQRYILKNTISIKKDYYPFLIAVPQSMLTKSTN